MNTFTSCITLRTLRPRFRFVRSFSVLFALSRDFRCTRIKLPWPFLPRQNPRNLKFFCAKILVTLLFSAFIFSFSLPSRYFQQGSNRRSAARLLLANTTMSSAYRTSFTPSAVHLPIKFIEVDVCQPRFLTLTSDFLQIPPHGGHPCLRLTLPTAERVVVFHHLAVTHAGRTSESGDAAFGISVGCVPAFFLMLRLYGRAVLTPAEHDFGGKGAILICKRTCAAVFLCNMGDGLDTDTVFPPLG